MMMKSVIVSIPAMETSSESQWICKGVVQTTHHWLPRLPSEPPPCFILTLAGHSLFITGWLAINSVPHNKAHSPLGLDFGTFLVAEGLFLGRDWRDRLFLVLLSLQPVRAQVNTEESLLCLMVYGSSNDFCSIQRHAPLAMTSGINTQRCLCVQLATVHRHSKHIFHLS